MLDTYTVLNSPFDIETHKATFVNYLEVVILRDGTIEYAVPSHQEKLYRIYEEQNKLTHKDAVNSIPKEYWCDVIGWLTEQTKCISVWNNFYTGRANLAQKVALSTLKRSGLYSGKI